eukprot:s1952_g6.t1
MASWGCDATPMKALVKSGQLPERVFALYLGNKQVSWSLEVLTVWTPSTTSEAARTLGFSGKQLLPHSQPIFARISTVFSFSHFQLISYYFHLQNLRGASSGEGLKRTLGAMAGLGIPVKLLHEGIGHTVTCELKTGEMYRGHLMNCEDNMNAMLEGVTVTGRDGKVTNLEQVYLRGSQIRYFILPDMLRHAPMFKKKGRGAGRGVYGPGGKGRGKGLAQRARTAAAATRK